MNGSFARTLAMALFVAASAAGQAILKVEPAVLVAGQSATITYSDPGNPGAKIDVEITDGAGNSATVTITLDGQGNGSAPWQVAFWSEAYFHAGDAEEVWLPILLP